MQGLSWEDEEPERVKGMKGGPGRPEEIGALWGGDLGKRLGGRLVGLPMAELEARLDGPERQGRKWDADTCGDPEPAGWRPLGHLLSEGHRPRSGRAASSRGSGAGRPGQRDCMLWAAALAGSWAGHHGSPLWGLPSSQ